MGKKQKCPEFENHERWLVSYADMVTLLFAVFVVLYAIQIAGQKDEQKVAGSMQESFSTPLEDIPVDRRIGPKEKGYGIFDYFRGNTPNPPLDSKFPGDAQLLKLIESEMGAVSIKLEDRLYGPNKHQAGKAKPGMERIVAVRRTKNGFKLQLLARHFYRAGASEIRPAAQRDLDAVARVLLELERPITIQGHTDSTPSQGRYDNWELSVMRAVNVLKYMKRQHNFPTTLMSVAGYADTRPIAHNGSASGRMLNRRIEFHVNYDPDSTPEP